MTNIVTLNLLGFIFLLKYKCCYGADFQVQTSYGTLQGSFYKHSSDSRSYCYFYGVPYAQIPTGDKRFTV